MQTEEKSFTADIIIPINFNPLSVEEMYKVQKEKIQTLKKMNSKQQLSRELITQG
jgi:hypothetical protein